jgi:hypothetical protein
VAILGTPTTLGQQASWLFFICLCITDYCRIWNLFCDPFLINTATRELKITKTEEYPKSENVSTGDDFTHGEENSICEVCYRLLKRVKEKDIIMADTKKMSDGIKYTLLHPQDSAMS